MTSMELEKKLMTEEEEAKLWEVFQVFDADASGGISSEELGQVMRSLGQSPNETELRDTIEEVDLDKSGSIDFEEFKMLMVSDSGDRQSRLKMSFSVFDEDGSGQITKNEMQDVMSPFGLTEPELDEMIEEADGDGNALIDFEEFCQLVPDESEITEKLGLKPRPSRTAFDSYSRGSTSSESRVLIFLDTKEPFNHCILKV